MINKAMLKENIKRLIAIPMAFLIVTIAFSILPLHIGDRVSALYWAFDLFHHQNFLLIMSTVLMTLILAVFLHPFYFDKKAAVHFHSLPATKAELFFTNLATGFIFILGFTLIISLLLLIPFHYGTNNTWSRAYEFSHTFSGVVFFFLRTLLGFIFYYTMFTLAINLSANRLVGVLFSAALMGLSLSISFFIYIIAYLYIFGHPGINQNFLTLSAIFTNPAMLGLAILDQGISTANIITTYIVLTVVFIAIGYFVAQKRRLEQVGSGIPFKPLENICIFLFSLFGAIISAMFFLAMMESIIGLYVGLVIGFLLFFIIAQTVLEKSIQIKHRLKLLIPNAIIMVILYFIISFSHIFMAGYINRIPQLNEIYAIELDNWWHGEEHRNSRKIRDEEAIGLATIFHEKILSTRAEYGNIPLQRIIGRNPFEQRFEIRYHLHNGEELHRVYYLPFEVAYSEESINFDSHEAVILRSFSTLNGVNEFEIGLIRIRLDRLIPREDDIFNHRRYEHEQVKQVVLSMSDDRIEPMLEAIREAVIVDSIHWLQRNTMITAYHLEIPSASYVPPVPLSPYNLTIEIQTLQNLTYPHHQSWWQNDWIDLDIKYAQQILEILELEIPQ
ncbi:MAG: hypothetical protein FWE02_03050 [Defluviitaleaceae bacterium]|nr:hypothetical protein [Defluviitaleaceae bacterium]